LCSLKRFTGNKVLEVYCYCVAFGCLTVWSHSSSVKDVISAVALCLWHHTEVLVQRAGF